MLFSSRDWQKQLSEKRIALDSYFSGLYFPPRGCLAQVQSWGRGSMGSIRSALWMVFHLQGINEKGNGKNFRSYLWEVSKVIYDHGFDSMLYILACVLMGMWWRKKGRRVLRFVGDHLKHFLSLLCLPSKYWTFRHFHAKCGLALAMKGSTIPLAIP